jgi:hypothetical protein
MKTPQQQAREAEAGPEAIEEIVEDLGQQDVLPPDTGAGTVMNDELEVTGEQAGRWDDPVGGQPHHAGRKALEDETKSSEILVQRGVAEAADELEEMEEMEASENPPEEGE